MTVSVTPAILKACMPAATQAACDTWAGPLSAAAKEFGIDTPAKMAAWLASTANESGSLSAMREGWRYTPERAAEIFGMSPDEVPRYQISREVWFERVYGMRASLGNTKPGDGGKTYGRGPGQITGGSNYRWVGGAIGVDLMANPDALLEPVTGSRAWAFYFTAGGCATLAADGTEAGFRASMKRMNSGLADFSPHVARWREVRRGLGIDGSNGAAGATILRVGDSGETVKRLQRALGIDDDGGYGPDTRDAVIAFQKRKGLDPDGVAGPKTLAALGIAA